HPYQPITTAHIMSHAEEYDPPSRRDSNNATPRSSQNKSKILEATMRNVPKLKELNYIQWKNVITNSIKNAKLWEYVDGSVMQPLEEDAGDLATYFDEAGAVRNAILGSLEPVAQKYIEEALDPRDAWLTLEKKYLTVEVDIDSKLVTIEKQLANLRLDEGGDMIEHIAEFCRMRSHLSGTRLALDDQASISMLYRSLPPSYRQSAVTSDGAEMKDFGALCARLSYLSQNPEPQTSADEAPTEDHANWGVPQDIKAFGLTGDRNPLLVERAAVTCRHCLLKGHKAGTSECPQYEWRKELWGTVVEAGGESASRIRANSQTVKSARKLTYKFSEPVKVVLHFSEMGLKKDIVKRMGELHISVPSAIQQCAITPMIRGRNVLAQAPKGGGKTTTVAISVLQTIDINIPKAQVLILTRDQQEATQFRQVLLELTQVGYESWIKCYLCDDQTSAEDDLSQVGIDHDEPVVLGSPARVLKLLRRGILQTRYLKMLVVDNVEHVIGAGVENQILEIQRCLPCSLQTLFTYTGSSLELIQATKDLMVDPLYLTVDDNTVFFHARHFFLVVPAGVNRANCMASLLQGFNARGIIAALKDPEANEASTLNTITKITETSRYSRSYTYTLTKNTPASHCDQYMQSFLSGCHNGYFPIMIVTDSAPLTQMRGVDQPNIPIVHYHAPCNRKEYAKRLAVYAASGKNTMVVTFIAAETDEINVIREVERHYSVQMVELHWDGKKVGWVS
ncbi:unnamed protein product, partial [Rhizoctonia solani]